MTSLADVLETASASERIRNPSEERFVTVRLNCGGAIERRIKDGKTPVPFTGYRVRAGQFIYSRIDARNGAFALVPPGLDGAVVSKDFPTFNVRADRIDPAYLVHLLRAGVLQAQIRNLSFGATNRQRIAEDVLLGLSIPGPPLPEQRRIAAILDHADAIRAKRRQVLAHLDDLTQSVFHEMFGSSPTPQRVRLGQIADWRTGGTPPRNIPEYFQGDIPWFSSGELGDLYVEDAREGITELAISNSSAKRIPAGSILVGMYDTAALKSSITIVEATCNQAVAFATPDPDTIDPLFAYFAIQEVRTRVLALRRGIRQKNLNLSMIREIEIPNAPKGAQHAFANRVRAINTARRAAQRSTETSTHLFTSVQSRAFDGRL